MRPLQLVFCLLLSCGSPSPRGDLHQEIKAIEAQLPKPKPGSLWADGFGRSAREAVQEAKRGISEQLSAEISSDYEAQEREVDGEVQRSIHLKLSSHSSFKHAELIETLAVLPHPGGFVARVSLDRGQAARIYREERQALLKQLEALGPLLKRGIRERDASLLLSTAHDPLLLLKQLRQGAQILRLLGHPPLPIPEEQALAWSRTLSPLRQRARIAWELKGGSPELQEAVLGLIRNMLKAKGCRFSALSIQEGPSEELELRGLLNIHNRLQEEGGMHWNHLGLSLQLSDARSGRSLLHFSALPQWIHAGGRDPLQAERNLLRRLKKRLGERARGDFEALNCR